MLIDHDRYRLLELEADRTGSSVAAVIRSAIDRLLVSVPSVRASAAAALLDAATPAAETAVEWTQVKQDLEAALSAKLP